ncbi:50S ribosomal protein L5 [bacterium]|nr:50S ribosomal protein L5 [candidate division CSSED10-310 bacterium]
MPNLKNKYMTEVTGGMLDEFKYQNKMEIPKMVKIVINAGLGEAIQNHKILETAAEEIALITGQKPVITRAKKSIAGFKLRQGMPIGCRVTLRGRKMYEFLDRLLNVALPRVRDFRGVSPKCFDGRGNYTLGIKDQIIFPEIDFDKVERVSGFSITFVTTAKSDEEGRSLLKRLGMPFRV